jgi:hypothetical protein
MIIAWAAFVLFFILSFISLVTGILDAQGKLGGKPALLVWVFAFISIMATSVAAQFIWGN